MPLRFRRSLRVLPGLRLNLGKTGASVSLGGRGLHETLGHGRARTTVGLPGTGISYTHQARTRRSARPSAPSSLVILVLKVAAALAVLVLLLRYG